MLLFGLTGGIASGKSTVARRFRSRGVPVIDADEVAREIVAPGSAALVELCAAFGDEILVGGVLDRKALGRLVFGDAERVRTLNAITHPRIALRTQERAASLAREGHVLACYEAALLVENGLAELFRPLVVVTAPRAVQCARIIARDGLTAIEADRRVDAQWPIADKVKVADHVIDNDGTEIALVERADAVLDAICDARGLPRFPAASRATP